MKYYATFQRKMKWLFHALFYSNINAGLLCPLAIYNISRRIETFIIVSLTTSRVLTSVGTISQDSIKNGSGKKVSGPISVRNVVPNSVINNYSSDRVTTKKRWFSDATDKLCVSNFYGLI